MRRCLTPTIAVLLGLATSAAAQERAPAPLTLEEELSLRPGDVFRECAECPEMVVVAGGEVRVGWPMVSEEEPFFRIPEGATPPEPTKVDGPFAIGRHEITVGAWRACVSDEVCRERPDLAGAADDLPLTGITYVETKHLIAWLTGRTGRVYAVPSRAQWEHAAKAGRESYFWWGDAPGEGKAHCAECGSPFPTSGPVPIASFPPNAYGLHDTAGNVSEWLTDCRPGQVEPCAVREAAGGDFDGPAVRAAASWRMIVAADQRVEWIGVRLMRRLRRG
jgi:formylglycine-generating enzyme required for sulfatase activity